MVKENINEIRSNQKVIINEFKNLKGWMKDIAEQVKITNGTVRKHDNEITILNEWKKAKEKVEDKLETMSRGKFLVIFMVILTVVGGIFLIILKRIIENILG